MYRMQKMTCVPPIVDLSLSRPMLRIGRVFCIPNSNNYFYTDQQGDLQTTLVNTPLVLEDKVVEYSVEYLQGNFSRTDLVLVGAGVDEAVDGGYSVGGGLELT